MKVSSSRFWLLLLLALVTAALVACSGGGSDDSSDDGDVADSEEATEATEGGTLIFGRGGDSTSLDPSRTTEGETFKVTKNIFETLLKFEDGGTAVEPGLAKSWETSEDGLTYTFELEEGVKFHDGTDFNADAVVANFERWAAGDAEMFPYYSSMFGGFGDDESHIIESVTAEDEYTVVFELKRPQAPFLKNIAMDMFAIASPTAFEEMRDDDYE